MYLVTFLYLTNVKVLKRVEDEEEGKEKEGEGGKKRETSDTNLPKVERRKR